ncbi:MULTISPECIES: FG-GAP repeat protein [Nostoc]|uniref:FG-GAP repeat protein n=1 Tax=Nostoc paludosum FACHB-159 TaxID=2692908 RepID=A0ABR8K617_9NOSO|nr:MULTISPECIES: FG-GAP repeat protein [Nostoc]MBD2683250.1 FG-GAP repeat protein [Nostoc sp. FACHB-857]MBD2734885.1 FG-GAP repeat protein [Nostoc paludosum FACHB-159]
MANSSFNLSDINGSNGFVINGIAADDFSGSSVSSAGDVNDDGFDDLIIGAPNADPNGSSSGQSYVVFGSSTGFTTSLNLSSLNGANGFVINGIAVYDNLGYFVSGAGDVNGDGIDDLIIGAPFASPNGENSGQSYVVFGKSTGFSSSLNLSSLNGTNGFAINGIAAGDLSGLSVSSAGDVNGDGLDDLIIGARDADPNGHWSGQSYVVFGKSKGFSSTLNLSSLNGINGFAINGIAAYDISGSSVSSAGDINGDGFDDLIIGAPNADPNGDASGQSYVVFGKSKGFSSTLNLSTLNGANGFIINGINAYDQSSASVSSAGDINGDGFDDLIIGAPTAGPNGSYSGQSYVVFGKSTGFSSTLNLSTLNGANGFAIINGISGYKGLGNSVSSAGDVNGDGFDDLIIGSFTADLNGEDSGQSFLVFGGSTGFSASLNLSTLNGVNGIAINGIAGNDLSGCSVSSAGDVNGDGFDDLIIGARYADPNGSQSGQSYVLFGGTNIGNTSNLTGTSGADTLIGTIGNNIIDGKVGNDILTGNGGQDRFVIRRGDGNDTITDFGGVGKGTSPSATVIANVDTLQFIGAGLTAQNLLLTQNGSNLEVTFENVSNTKVTLKNFQLENLDNLKASGSKPAIGNILFDGQTTIIDNFNVLDANSTDTAIGIQNTVTFLNDLNNQITGLDNSADVINGQGGNDKIDGKSGNDLLRGGAGNDSLVGGAGNDSLVGGAGNDTLVGGAGSDRLTGGVGADYFLYNTNAAFVSSAIGQDTITDFNRLQGDKIILDKTTFSAITSAAGTGFSNASDFKIISNGATSTAKIVYDPVSGQLFYNQNGSAAGFGSGGLFATLSGVPTLTATDFIIQA